MRDPGNLDETVSGVRDGDGDGPSAAFTPGRWTAFPADPGGAWGVRAVYQENGLRMTAFPAICQAGAQPNEANARLIAAAPEMASAAEPLVAEISEYAPSAGEDDDERVTVRLGDLKALQRALAKALGSSAADTSARNVPEREDGGGASVARAEVAASTGVKSDSAEGH